MDININLQLQQHLREQQREADHWSRIALNMDASAGMRMGMMGAVTPQSGHHRSHRNQAWGDEDNDDGSFDGSSLPSIHHRHPSSGYNSNTFAAQSPRTPHPPSSRPGSSASPYPGHNASPLPHYPAATSHGQQHHHRSVSATVGSASTRSPRRPAQHSPSRARAPRSGPRSRMRTQSQQLHVRSTQTQPSIFIPSPPPPMHFMTPPSATSGAGAYAAPATAPPSMISPFHQLWAHGGVGVPPSMAMPPPSFAFSPASHRTPQQHPPFPARSSSSPSRPAATDPHVYVIRPASSGGVRNVSFSDGEHQTTHMHPSPTNGPRMDMMPSPFIPPHSSFPGYSRPHSPLLNLSDPHVYLAHVLLCSLVPRGRDDVPPSLPFFPALPVRQTILDLVDTDASTDTKPTDGDMEAMHVPYMRPLSRLLALDLTGEMLHHASQRFSGLPCTLLGRIMDSSSQSRNGFGVRLEALLPQPASNNEGFHLHHPHFTPAHVRSMLVSFLESMMPQHHHDGANRPSSSPSKMLPHSHDSSPSPSSTTAHRSELWEATRRDRLPSLVLSGVSFETAWESVAQMAQMGVQASVVRVGVGNEKNKDRSKMTPNGTTMHTETETERHLFALGDDSSSMLRDGPNIDNSSSSSSSSTTRYSLHLSSVREYSIQLVHAVAQILRDQQHRSPQPSQQHGEAPPAPMPIIPSMAMMMMMMMNTPLQAAVPHSPQQHARAPFSPSSASHHRPTSSPSMAMNQALVPGPDGTVFPTSTPTPHHRKHSPSSSSPSHSRSSSSSATSSAFMRTLSPYIPTSVPKSRHLRKEILLLANQQHLMRTKEKKMLLEAERNSVVKNMLEQEASEIDRREREEKERMSRAQRELDERTRRSTEEQQVHAGLTRRAQEALSEREQRFLRRHEELSRSSRDLQRNFNQIQAETRQLSNESKQLDQELERLALERLQLAEEERKMLLAKQLTEDETTRLKLRAEELKRDEESTQRERDRIQSLEEGLLESTRDLEERSHELEREKEALRAEREEMEQKRKELDAAAEAQRQSESESNAAIEEARKKLEQEHHASLERLQVERAKLLEEVEKSKQQSFKDLEAEQRRVERALEELHSKENTIHLSRDLEAESEKIRQAHEELAKAQKEFESLQEQKRIEYEKSLAEERAKLQAERDAFQLERALAEQAEKDRQQAAAAEKLERYKAKRAARAEGKSSLQISTELNSIRQHGTMGKLAVSGLGSGDFTASPAPPGSASIPLGSPSLGSGSSDRQRRRSKSMAIINADRAFEQALQASSTKLIHTPEDIANMTALEKKRFEMEQSKHAEMDEMFRQFLGYSYKQLRKNGPPPIYLYLHLALEGLDRANALLGSLPLVELHNVRGKTSSLVVETEHGKGENVVFRPLLVDVAQLCAFQMDRPILFRVMQHARNADEKRDYIAETRMTLVETQVLLNGTSAKGKAKVKDKEKSDGTEEQNSDTAASSSSDSTDVGGTPLLNLDQLKKLGPTKYTSSGVLRGMAAASLYVQSTYGLTHWPSPNLKDDPVHPSFEKLSQCLVRMEVRATNLTTARGLFGPSKDVAPFLEIRRKEPPHAASEATDGVDGSNSSDGQWSTEPIYRSEIQLGQNVAFAPITVGLWELCFADLNRPLQVRLMHDANVGKADLITELVLTLGEVLTDVSSGILSAQLVREYPAGAADKKGQRSGKLLFGPVHTFSALTDLPKLCENADLVPTLPTRGTKDSNEAPPLGLDKVLEENRARIHAHAHAASNTNNLQQPAWVSMIREQVQNEATNNNTGTTSEKGGSWLGAALASFKGGGGGGSMDLSASPRMMAAASPSSVATAPPPSSSPNHLRLPSPSPMPSTPRVRRSSAMVASSSSGGLGSPLSPGPEKGTIGRKHRRRPSSMKSDEFKLGK